MERSSALPVTRPMAGSDRDTGRSKTLAERLAAARRRRLPAMAAAATVLIIALATALLWPPTYRSTGTILIEQQEVPIDIVRPMISSYADQRIQVITQRVMTTDNLMRIIERYDLYPGDRRKLPREELIERMRDDIGFRMISADVVDPRVGRPTKATIAFAVSYDSDSPAVAAKVANELTTLYLNENLASRKQLADNTASFLADEAERLSSQIAAQEAAVAAFKEKNLHSLPELAQMNLSLMNRTEDELRETDSQLRSIEQQIVYLDAQLAQLEPASQIFTSTGERVMSASDRLKVLKADYAQARASYAPDHPDVVRMKREIEGLEAQAGAVDTGNDPARQLKDARGQLAEAREKYAAGHPDVVKLQRTVAGLEKSMTAAHSAGRVIAEEADNPAYLQVSARLEASINSKAELLNKRGQLQHRVDDFAARIAHTPQIEREYSGMLRELENARLKYREVRQKQMEATVSKNLETERRGERFTLIEPPLQPQEPVSPNRTIILVLGLLLSAAAAIGLIALLEALDGSLYGRRDVQALLAVPPLAVLPWIDTAQDIAARVRLRKLSFAGAAGSIIACIALVHLFVRPLDVLWQVAWRRLLS